MGVYIKGMSKPKNCRRCYFNGSDLFCLITRGKIDRDDYICEIGCPLVEVKTPHGRLIDEDDILATWDAGSNGEILNYVAPTVIEEEVE